jgi:hypothetical protein
VPGRYRRYGAAAARASYTVTHATCTVADASRTMARTRRTMSDTAMSAGCIAASGTASRTATTATATTATATTATTTTAASASSSTSEQRGGHCDDQYRYEGYCNELGYFRHDDLLRVQPRVRAMRSELTMFLRGLKIEAPGVVPREKSK